MGQGSDKEFFLNFGLKISPYWEINADRFKGKSSRDGEARHHTQLQDGKIFGLARCSRGECSRTLYFSCLVSKNFLWELVFSRKFTRDCRCGFMLRSLKEIKLALFGILFTFECKG
jgi:hypothetical protein